MPSNTQMVGLGIGIGVVGLGILGAVTAGVPCMQGQVCVLDKLQVRGGLVFSDAGFANINSHNGVFNILDYGAKCDGVASAAIDTNGIKNAVTVAGNDNDIVVPPTGHPCKLNDRVVLLPGQSLFGPGINSATYFDCTAVPGASFDCLQITANSKGDEIAFLRLVGNTTGADGILTQFGSALYLHDLKIDSFTNGLHLQDTTESLIQNVGGNLNTRGLWVERGGSMLFNRWLWQNSGSGGNFLCSACGNLIIDTPLQDELSLGPNWRITDGADIKATVGEFFSSETNQVGVMIDSAIGGASQNITIEGAHFQQFSSGEAPEAYFVYVDAGTNIRFKNVVFDGNASIVSNPDGGLFDPPTIAAVFVSATSQVFFENSRPINDGGLIPPWQIEGVLVDAGFIFQNNKNSIGYRGCDAGTGGLLSVTFTQAFGSQPSCICSDTNSTLSACDVTARNTNTAQFKATGTDVICWSCGDINNN